MTNTKHTSGPWGIRQQKSIMDNALLIVASTDSGKTFGGHVVTQLCDTATYKGCTNFSPEEQKANAQLIAAAPELLGDAEWAADKARAMLDALSAVSWDDELVCDIRAGLDEIRAQHERTVAKTRGEKALAA